MRDIHNEVVFDLLEVMKQYVYANGIYMKIRKFGDHFIITQASGDKMMKEMNIPKERYVGFSSKDYPLVMPTDCAERKLNMLNQMWDEKCHGIYKGYANGINYYALAVPICKNGKISHLNGYMFYSRNVLDDVEQVLHAYHIPYNFFEVAI